MEKHTTLFELCAEAYIMVVSIFAGIGNKFKIRNWQTNAVIAP